MDDEALLDSSLAEIADEGTFISSGNSSGGTRASVSSTASSQESSSSSQRNHFHDDLEHNTFGKIVKGTYFPASDFRFDLVAKVICCESENTGYTINVYPERVGDEEIIPMESFIRAGAVHRRDHFISCINQACEGGLSCSFVDKEVTQYWQHKKRLSIGIPQKRAVAIVGKQDDGTTWVLSKHTHIDSTIGSLIPAESSSYVWLSHLCHGRGIATSSDAVCIPHPLTTDGLLPLIEAITVTTKHNSPAALMVLGSACMSLHYKTIIEVNGECPAPFICGNVGTGKSLALRAALSILGCHKSRFYSRGTREKYALLLGKSTFPLGIDDPQKVDSIGELMVDLFNGGKSTTVAHGDIEPMSSGIITANFNLSEKAKYYTRAVMIPFSDPPLGGDLSHEDLEVFSSLPARFTEASRSVGFVIQLGNKLKEEGFAEIREDIYPFVKDVLQEHCHPRVMMGYSVMLWFTYNIISAASLEHLKDEVNTHFVGVVGAQIQSIHSKSPHVPAEGRVCVSNQARLSTYINELMDKFEPHERANFARADQTFTLPTGVMENVFTFRYENVPPNKLSFTKREFVNAVAFGKLGQPNRKKNIGHCREKCTLVFLKCLDDDLRLKVIEEFPESQPAHNISPPSQPTAEPMSSKSMSKSQTVSKPSHSISKSPTPLASKSQHPAFCTTTKSMVTTLEPTHESPSITSQPSSMSATPLVITSTQSTAKSTIPSALTYEPTSESPSITSPLVITSHTVPPPASSAESPTPLASKSQLPASCSTTKSTSPVATLQPTCEVPSIISQPSSMLSTPLVITSIQSTAKSTIPSAFTSEYTSESPSITSAPLVITSQTIPPPAASAESPTPLASKFHLPASCTTKSTFAPLAVTSQTAITSELMSESSSQPIAKLLSKAKMKSKPTVKVKEKRAVAELKDGLSIYFEADEPKSNFECLNV